MAFNVNYIARQTSSLTHIDVGQLYSYNGSSSGADDTLSEIKASAYFNNFIISTNSYGFSVGDWIYVNASDGVDIVQVTAVSPNVTVSSILGQLPAASVSLEDLDSGIAPSHVVKYAGEHTTAGGGAAEAITVTGVLATDLVFCQLHTAGATPRTVLTAVASADTVTVTFSGDPSTDHVVAYQVLRAAS